MKKNTIVVAAFPGCGKSHLFRSSKDKIVLDSDSSLFDKAYFPNNYIKHIQENIGVADIILVSSHKVVRDALVDNNIDFVLVYPNIKSKDEYIQRYIQRKSPQGFIDLISSNWDNWINECKTQKGCGKIELKENQYLSDWFKI